jgi:hypothetical protein
MHNPYGIEHLSKENRGRVAWQVDQFRAKPKQEEALERPGLLLKARLVIATVLALFFGG